MSRIAGFWVACLCALTFSLSGVAIAQDSKAPQAAGTVSDTPAYQYRLGSGDKLQITTFGEPSLSGTFEVSGSGMVAVPLVGQVKALGLTTVEFGHAMEADLRDGFLKNPSVSIEVLNYRPFFILGEVNKPGEYPFTNGLTVLNAVATANGFTYRANTHHVLIKRADETSEHDIDLSASTVVLPGDTIRIKERYF